MIVIISIFSILVLFLVFFKFEWGVGMFMLYCLLVPTYGLNIGYGFVIGRNLFTLLLLVGLLVWAGKKGGLKRSFVMLMMPFLLLYIVQFLLIGFHTDKMPLSAQFENFRLNIMGLFLPFTIIGVSSVNCKNAKIFNRILYVAICVSSFYSFFLITCIGQNPYIDAVTPLLDNFSQFDQDNVILEGVRRFGYISSVYTHVTEYGDFLIFSSVFLLYQFGIDKSFVPRIMFALVTICVLICGSRSVLMAFTVIVLVYLLMQNRFKVFSIAILMILVVILLIHLFIPEYFIYVKSIGDDSLSGGSSLEMRLDQLRGCFDSIKDNPLFGNGYGWTGWYRSNIGRHPVMLSFESILIQILCNNGIIGVITYIVVTVLVLTKIKKIFPNNTEIRKMVSLLFIGYYCYAFFTGDYGMMAVMMWFYAILIANGIKEREEEVKRLNTINR